MNRKPVSPSLMVSASRCSSCSGSRPAPTGLHVPYKGGGPAITDLLGGQVDASFMNINTVHASTSRPASCGRWPSPATKRSPLLPDVPTLAEAGVKDVDVYSWQAVAAPKGLPADVQDKLHAAIVAALNDPAVKQQLLGSGFEIVGQHAGAVRRLPGSRSSRAGRR